MRRTIMYASLHYKLIIMKTKLTLAITFILLFFKTSFSQKDEINVLFLGNSYVFANNLPEIISEMTEGTSKSIIERNL